MGFAMLGALSNLQYPKFKLAIISLLALDILFFAIFDTLTSLIDQIVWFSLLLLYELEANNINFASETTLNKVRTALIVLTVLVFLNYAESNEWLDVINFIFWFALIALLEVEVRWPGLILHYPKIYKWGKLGIFSCLILMVLAWIFNKEWLDAWDAALWIVAFFVIESDVHQFMEHRAT